MHACADVLTVLDNLRRHSWKKRRDKYTWKPVMCKAKCGMMQLVPNKRRKERKRCKAHARTKRDKWVPETDALVRAKLLEMGHEITGRYQEWPVGRLDKSADFSSRFRMHIDLAYQFDGMLIAVEVHGSAEHKHDEKTIARDKDKVAAWGDEVAAQSADAWPRCMGAIVTIWAPELVPEEDGGPLSEAEWERLVSDKIATHVLSALATARE